jgi:diphthamide synthase (EF-2-diphthine--ammonia ligase)
VNLLSEKLLGHRIDRDFIKELIKNPNVDLCGEAGEYHTFVTDGPLFKKRIKLIEVEKILNNGYWFWDIAKYEICCK